MKIKVLYSWIDKAKPDKNSAEKADLFIGKETYLFATLGASPTSDHGKDCINNMKDTYKDSKILGAELVQGSVSQDVINVFMRMPKDHPHAITEEKLNYYKSIEGRPNQEDIDTAFNKLIASIEVVAR